MTTYDTLAADQLTTFDEYLRARPFRDDERAYFKLCWLAVTDQQLADINAALPPDTVWSGRELNGTKYINVDIISDAIDSGRLAGTYDVVSGLTWKYINPWDWGIAEELDAWVQPTGAQDAYDVGAKVTHATKDWFSTTPANVWEPGVFGWQEIVLDGTTPAWRQPLGAGDTWALDAEVIHNGRKWKSTLANNVWEPGVTGWDDITETEPSGPLPWVQPTGAQDAYAVGDQVTHNGSTWQSNTPANVWEPGVFGWDQI